MFNNVSKFVSLGVVFGILTQASNARALPTREGGTYFGGSEGSDTARDVAFTSGSSFVVVGETSSSGMSTSGSHDPGLTGAQDGFISMWDSVTAAPLWSTYYGGSGEDKFEAVALNSSDEIYAVGYTTSNVWIATPGAHKTLLGGAHDVMLVKFDSSGTRLWSTYFGGPSVETGGGGAGATPAVCVASNGMVYIVGATASSSGIATAGAHDTSLNSTLDGFVAKFSSAGILQWATYYGGNGETMANGCAVDSAGNIYVVGETQATTGIATGGHDNSHNGDTDAFMVKFNSSGVRQWGTYYGGTEYERFANVGTDQSDNVYVAGHTYSSTGIATAGAHDTINGGLDGFVAKFNPSGVRQWGTYFGGNTGDSFSDIHVGGSIYLAGQTNDPSLASPSAFDSTIEPSSYDPLYVNMSLAGVVQHVTFNGGSDWDTAYGVAASPLGTAVLVGATNSTNNIATTGAFDTTYAGTLDAFITVIRLFFV